MKATQLKKCSVILRRLEEEKNHYFLKCLERKKTFTKAKVEKRVLKLNDAIFGDIFGNFNDDCQKAKEMQRRKKEYKEIIQRKKLKQECLVRKCFVKLDKLSRSDIKAWRKESKRHKSKKSSSHKIKTKSHKENGKNSSNRHAKIEKLSGRDGRFGSSASFSAAIAPFLSCKDESRQTSIRKDINGNSPVPKTTDKNSDQKNPPKIFNVAHQLVKVNPPVNCANAPLRRIGDHPPPIVASDKKPLTFLEIGEPILESRTNGNEKIVEKSLAVRHQNNVDLVLEEDKSLQETVSEEIALNQSNLFETLLVDLPKEEENLPILCQDAMDNLATTAQSNQKLLNYNGHFISDVKSSEASHEFNCEKDNLNVSTNSGGQVVKKSLKDYVSKKTQYEETEIMMRRILDGVIEDIFVAKWNEGPIKWFCPICPRFDKIRGSVDDHEVKMHIVRQHGLSILDTDLKSSQVKSGLFSCPFCAEEFPSFHALNFHLAYHHQLLMHKARDLDLDPLDYLPIPFDRLGKEIKFKCLRCSEAQFSDRSQMMLHLALSHYKELLVPCDILRSRYRKLGHYACSQVHCHEVFSTMQGLVAHEQIAHDALQIYMGDFTDGTNDLYEECL